MSFFKRRHVKYALMFWSLILLLASGCGKVIMNQKPTNGSSSISSAPSTSPLQLADLAGKNYYIIESNGFTCRPFSANPTPITSKWSDKLGFSSYNNEISVTHYGSPCNDAYIIDPFSTAVYNVSPDQQTVIYQGKTYSFRANDIF